MSTSARKKAQRQAEHAKQKAERKFAERFASKKTKKNTFTEYTPKESYVRETPKYPSLTSTNPHVAAKPERVDYTGDLICGIATMHKSNIVPVMRGTSQAEDIAKMRRN